MNYNKYGEKNSDIFVDQIRQKILSYHNATGYDTSYSQYCAIGPKKENLNPAVKNICSPQKNPMKNLAFDFMKLYLSPT